jgi:tetratricopeptide (TPR) repeat protein
VHRLSGDLESALADLTRAIELGAGSGWSLATRGMVHRLMSRHDEALADLRASLEIEPSSWAHYQLGICMTLLGDGGEGAFHLGRALELERGGLAEDPEENWSNHVNIALCLMARGERDAALESVRTALERTIPRDDLAEALVEVADLHDALGIDVSEITEAIRDAMDGPGDGPASPAH